jgi:ABC-type multidrug transport system ATPase subunit
MKAINEEPWTSRTFLISTNNTKLLEFVDRVIFVDKGNILFKGTYEELQAQPQFQTLLKENAKNDKGKSIEDSEVTIKSDFSRILKQRQRPRLKWQKKTKSKSKKRCKAKWQ